MKYITRIKKGALTTIALALAMGSSMAIASPYDIFRNNLDPAMSELSKQVCASVNPGNPSCKISVTYGFSIAGLYWWSVSAEGTGDENLWYTIMSGAPFVEGELFVDVLGDVAHGAGCTINIESSIPTIYGIVADGVCSTIF